MSIAVLAGPAEQAGVELECGVEVGGVQLVPSDFARAPARGRHHAACLGGGKERERGSLRIVHDGEPPDVRNGFRRAMDPAAGRGQFGQCLVQVGHPDIAVANAGRAPVVRAEAGKSSRPATVVSPTLRRV